jgi:hypothetical protein
MLSIHSSTTRCDWATNASKWIVVMNAMNNVLDQVLASSRVYLTWLALRGPQTSGTPSGPISLPAPADFNDSWTQFTTQTAFNGIPELESPLSD